MRRRKPRPPRASALTPETRLGGYRVAELDAALVRSERSDPVSIGLRLLQIAIVHGLLAAAVLGGLPAQALLLPLLIELLGMFVIGSLMAALLVDCPAFRESLGSLPARLIFGAVLVALSYGLLASLPELGPVAARDPRSVLDWMRAQGLLWPSLAAVTALAVHSLREGLKWRRAETRAGEVFVWTSIQFIATRFAVLVVLALLVGIPLGLLLPGLGPALAGLGDQARWMAWGVWTLLLLLDGGATLVLAGMHRDASRAS